MAAPQPSRTLEVQLDGSQDELFPLWEPDMPGVLPGETVAFTLTSGGLIYSVRRSPWLLPSCSTAQLTLLSHGRSSKRRRSATSSTSRSRATRPPSISSSTKDSTMQTGSEYSVRTSRTCPSWPSTPIRRNTRRERRTTRRSSRSARARTAPSGEHWRQTSWTQTVRARPPARSPLPPTNG